MSVNRDKKRGTWMVQIRWRDKGGKYRHTTKRGFKTKAEAQAYNRRFISEHEDINDILFDDFCDTYLEDVSPRLKENTLITKRYVIEKKLRPYFGKMRMGDIDAAEVLRWENDLLANDYASTTLHTDCNQLSAIFNHAVNYYGLRKNPMRIAGKVGSKETDREMSFWTLEEFNQFVFHLEDKPESYMAFNTLYWAGLRVGELLALTPSDIDLDEGVIHVRHSYQRIGGKDVITTPKTWKSIRDVMMPDFLVDDYIDYFSALPDLLPDERIYQMTKNKLRHEMKRGCKAAGMEPIRIHDLRHSHVSLLINLGMNPAAIADRVGHSSVEITQTYSHLFPSTQVGLVNALNKAGGINE